MALEEMLKPADYARRSHALVEEASELVEASWQDAVELKLCASTRYSERVIEQPDRVRPVRSERASCPYVLKTARVVSAVSDGKQALRRC